MGDQNAPEMSLRGEALAIAATGLIQKIDRPGMTIELLRISSEAQLLRKQNDDFMAWLFSCVAAMPEERCPREYRLFLHYWLVERRRHENQKSPLASPKAMVG